MTGIFHGKTALRFKYADLTYTDLIGKTTLADAVLLTRFNASTKIAFFHNAINADIVVSVVHPDADVNALQSRLVLFEIPAITSLNVDMLGATAMEIDAGTYMYIHLDPFSLGMPVVQPNKGKVRIVHWG